jgi:hypothetical protein
MNTFIFRFTGGATTTLEGVNARDALDRAGFPASVMEVVEGYVQTTGQALPYAGEKL